MKFLFNSKSEKQKENITENKGFESKFTNTNSVTTPVVSQNTDVKTSAQVTPTLDANGKVVKTSKVLEFLKKHKGLIIMVLFIPISIVLVILALYYVVLGSASKSNLPGMDTSFALVESKVKEFNPKDFYYTVPLSEVTVRDKQNPFNGELLTSEQYKALSVYRPIAVSTDNQQDAKPQSGVSEADIVYELPVEGGISRYLAFYWSSFPKSMGPVRSFRPYFGDIVQEYDALLYHIGQSEISDAALQTNPELTVYDSSIYFSQNNIKRTSCGYVRDAERIKNQVAIEHTAYISVDNLRSCVSESDYKGLSTITALKYKPDMDYSLRSNNSSATIYFGSGGGSTGNRSEWVYNRTENNYRKVIDGKDDIDRNNSQSIKVKNLIIEIAPIKSDYNSAGRLSINIVGQGKAIFMLDGKVVEGIWQKDSKTARTKYYKSDGSELELNRGKIWVSIIGNDSKYQVQ